MRLSDTNVHKFKSNSNGNTSLSSLHIKTQKLIRWWYLHEGVSNNGNEMCSMIIWEKNPQMDNLGKPQRQHDFEDWNNINTRNDSCMGNCVRRTRIIKKHIII